MQKAASIHLASGDHAGRVSVWWRALTARAEALGEYRSWLSAAEVARAERFGRERSAERYIIGRATLRLLLSSATGMRPADVPIVRAPRGRPQVSDGSSGPGVDFNVSHTREAAVYAICDDAPATWRVGIDVEHVERSPAWDRLSRRVLTPDERARMSRLDDVQRRLGFLATWTCKEAMSKATGDGISAPFRAIGVEAGEAPRVVQGTGRYDPQQWLLRRVRIDPSLIVTLAVLTGSRETGR